MSETGVVRLLIVEDQAITRLGLRMGLKSFNDIEIVGESEDGLEAIEMAQSLKPDVILLDLGLPKLNGLEACKRIKESIPEIQIVMFTSHDSPEEAFAALSGGADGYCLKNASTEQIHRALLSVHEGAVWLDANLGSQLMSMVKIGSNHADSDYGLSGREVDLLQMAVDGLSDSEIANRISLSEETVKTHMKRILQKLSASDRTQAAVKALREGRL
jgi:DNA-binding NarL/FixJ family response regulator